MSSYPQFLIYNKIILNFWYFLCKYHEKAWQSNLFWFIQRTEKMTIIQEKNVNTKFISLVLKLYHRETKEA